MKESGKSRHIGKRKYLQDSMDVAEIYFEIAENDEKAAKILVEKGLYNQAAYFLIQAMEKQIKYKIATKVDITNKYFADEVKKTMGHSLEASVQFLIKIYTGNNAILKRQMDEQLMEQVLRKLNFQGVHNNVRYPLYHERYISYSFLDISKDECCELARMLDSLKRYLSDLDKI